MLIIKVFKINTKKIVILLFTFYCIGILNNVICVRANTPDPPPISFSGTVGLFNGEYYAVEIKSYGFVSWSFSSSNPSISIEVRKMGPTNFEKFERGASSLSWAPLSDGQISDSGSYTKGGEYWASYDYIIFLNEDSDNQYTDLTYLITVERIYYELSDEFNLDINLLLILITILLWVIHTIIFIRYIIKREPRINSKSKRKRMDQLEEGDGY